MTAALPKGWTETGYRCYRRSIGPLTLQIWYSCVSQSFKAVLNAGLDRVELAVVCEDLHELIDEEDDARLLRVIASKAKGVIRGWK